MNPQIDLQIACEDSRPVNDENLKAWVQMTLDEHQSAAELTLRLVDIEEITDLNTSYRKKNKATNVLAFPSNLPEVVELDYPFLGDIIICPKVLLEESREQNTPLDAHWAHIVIHGVLHLLGYDHIEEDDSKIMQAMEIKLLSKLGFENPYREEDIHCE